MSPPGFEEGSVCGRNSCTGIIKVKDVESYYCHISAPCSQCTEPRLYCPLCWWDESEEPAT